MSDNFKTLIQGALSACSDGESFLADSLSQKVQSLNSSFLNKVLHAIDGQLDSSDKMSVSVRSSMDDNLYMVTLPGSDLNSIFSKDNDSSRATIKAISLNLNDKFSIVKERSFKLSDIQNALEDQISGAVDCQDIAAAISSSNTYDGLMNSLGSIASTGSRKGKEVLDYAQSLSKLPLSQVTQLLYSKLMGIDTVETQEYAFDDAVNNVANNLSNYDQGSPASAWVSDVDLLQGIEKIGSTFVKGCKVVCNLVSSAAKTVVRGVKTVTNKILDSTANATAFTLSESTSAAYNGFDDSIYTKVFDLGSKSMQWLFHCFAVENVSDQDLISSLPISGTSSLDDDELTVHINKLRKVFTLGHRYSFSLPGLVIVLFRDYGPFGFDSLYMTVKPKLVSGKLDFKNGAVRSSYPLTTSSFSDYFQNIGNTVWLGNSLASGDLADNADYDDYNYASGLDTGYRTGWIYLCGILSSILNLEDIIPAVRISGSVYHATDGHDYRPWPDFFKSANYETEFLSANKIADHFTGYTNYYETPTDWPSSGAENLETEPYLIRFGDSGLQPRETYTSLTTDPSYHTSLAGIAVSCLRKLGVDISYDDHSPSSMDDDLLTLLNDIGSHSSGDWVAVSTIKETCEQLASLLLDTPFSDNITLKDFLLDLYDSIRTVRGGISFDSLYINYWSFIDSLSPDLAHGKLMNILTNESGMPMISTYVDEFILWAICNAKETDDIFVPYTKDTPIPRGSLSLTTDDQNKEKFSTFLKTSAAIVGTIVTVTTAFKFRSKIRTKYFATQARAQQLRANFDGSDAQAKELKRNNFTSNILAKLSGASSAVIDSSVSTVLVPISEQSAKNDSMSAQITENTESIANLFDRINYIESLIH